MTRKEHVIISLGAVIGGWVLCGFAMTTTLFEQATTVCIIAGLVFSVVGFISLILALKKPTVRK